MTYGAVALAVGNPGAARAVGSVLNRYDAAVYKVPCHRVVRSDGTPGGYRWGADKKKKLLREEGSLV